MSPVRWTGFVIFGKTLLMKLFLPFVLTAIFASRASGQLIYGSLKTFACAGTVSNIQTASGYASGYFWQVSTDNGTTWSTITDNGIYSFSTTGELNIYPFVPMTGYLYRYAATATPTVFSDADTLVVFSASANRPVFVGPTTSVCQGQTIVYTVSGNLARDSTYWSATNATSLITFGAINDTVNLVNFPTTGSATVSAISNNGCGNFDNAGITVTVNPLQTTLGGTAGGGPDCATFSVMPGVATTYSDGTCSPIAAVTPSGSSPVSGSIQSCVTVDASVPTYNGIPYLSRYYNIEPVVNASTSTATVTLYYTQADFDAYNTARGSFPALPTGPSDATGISNLTISQFHGTGTTPDTYVGGSGTITPTSVVWNSTASRWEVTFNITGFSGFFVSGSSIIPLPLTLTDFTGRAMTAGNLLSWTTAMEENTAYFAVQRVAADGSAAGGSGFQTLAKVPAAGNSNLTLQYSYMDTLTGAAHPAYSYRLQMTDLDGKYTYSNIVTLQPLVSALAVRISPNPFVRPESLVVSTPAAGSAVLAVTDVNGRKLAEKALVLQQGDNSLDPSLISNLHPGLYFIHVSMGTQQQTIRFVRE
jgi:hypothetical protein